MKTFLALVGVAALKKPEGVDDLPDAATANKIVNKMKKDLVLAEFAYIRPKIVNLTKKAIARGDSYVTIDEHNFVRPETKQVIMKYLQHAGYDVDTVRGYDRRGNSCYCGSHFRWSWANSKERRVDGEFVFTPEVI